MIILGGLGIILTLLGISSLTLAAGRKRRRVQEDPLDAILAQLRAAQMELHALKAEQKLLRDLGRKGTSK